MSSNKNSSGPRGGASARSGPSSQPMREDDVEAGEQSPLLEGQRRDDDEDDEVEAEDLAAKDDFADWWSSLSFETRTRTAYVLKIAGITAVTVAIVALVVLGVRAVRSVPSGRGGHRPKDGGSVPDPFKLPPPAPGLRNPSYLVRGRHGAAATESEICSKIALDLLKENATATDAAISAALCVGVVNSFSSGIGGGGFLVIRPGDGDSSNSKKHKHGHSSSAPISIDYRETSPEGSHADMYVSLDASASKIGGLAVGVPGELRGFEQAYKLHGGGVSWERIFAPNIELAEKGWEVSAELDRRLKYFGGFMIGKKEWEEIFAPHGRLLTKGQTIKRPAYARTLRTLAEKGADAFYTGPIADSTVKTIRKAGGMLSHKDLANYKANVAPAIQGTYHGKTIYTTDAPTSGPVLIHLLNILEHYKLEEQGRTPLNMHRFVEALKFAFARRTSLGDPAFFPEQEKKLDTIMSKSYAKETVERLTDNRTHHLSYYGPEFAHLDDHGTTHLSVVDSNGSAVSLTTTVNLIFGSRVMDPETGIIFNDEQDDFATPGKPDAFGLYPSPYNFPDHNKAQHFGKRPLSSTSATIIDDENGDFYLALGGSGGSRIFGAVAQVILNLDWGYDLSHAIEEPRVHDQLLPEHVSVESGLREDLLDGLRQRGHNISLFDINLGIAEVQAVMQSPDGWIYGASDSRKNGVALAY